ncbi:MAG: hypothetical protein RBR78_09050 [Flavobacteriaceae bacterium]|nr:hypothetical protein [Flavobacteriaceae bacterium]HTO35617.1 hypothetical protein [Flavobacterium sp.]
MRVTSGKIFLALITFLQTFVGYSENSEQIQQTPPPPTVPPGLPIDDNLIWLGIAGIILVIIINYRNKKKSV